LDWGLCFTGYGTGVMAVPCGDEEIMLLRISLKDKTECQLSKIFLIKTFLAAYGAKEGSISRFRFFKWIRL
jgi:hypothetical protein